MAKRKPNNDLFDTKELETIQFIFDYVKRHKKEHLLEMSHEEPAYTETEEGGLSSYAMAKKLLLD